MILLLLGAVPWPGGAAPAATEVDALVDHALLRFGRDQERDFASAVENEQENGVAEFLIRDIPPAELLDTLFFYGTRFFQLPFRRKLGRGGLVPEGRVRRVHAGLAGGLDGSACDGCHSVGGRDGGGSFGQSAAVLGDGVHLASASLRNPPALLGLGLVQALAAEMSAELARQRAGLAVGESVELVAKGVHFGRLHRRAEGYDTSEVEGVDPDLVLRPFGWKGEEARLRRFVEEAARLHFGVLSTRLEAEGDPDRTGRGPPWDRDGDGVLRELEDGVVSATTVYFEMVEAPAVVPPADPGLQARWAAGEARFAAIGCADCHRPVVPLDDARWTEVSDDPEAPAVAVHLLRDGEGPKGDDRVALYSDLKRHDMGPGLAEQVEPPGGPGSSVFLTRPLWGVAESPPWLHDGRALDLGEAILAHGGEAQAARDAYARLGTAEQVDLRLFLLTLSRAPRPRVAR